MISLIEFYIYSIILHFIFCDKSIEIQLIKNYVQHQNDSFAVSAFLCWENEDNIKITKELNDINIVTRMSTSEIAEFPDKIGEINILYILDTTCDFSLQILNLANKTNRFLPFNKWFILNSQQFPETLYNNYKIYINTNAFLATKISETNYELKYIYKITRNSNILNEIFASWNYENGFIYYDSTEFWRKRRNLQKHSLISAMAILDNSTYEHMTDYRLNEIDTSTKINYILTLYLIDFLNATLKIKYVPTWYNTKSNDQNNTLIGVMIMKQVDFSTTPFFCKKERLSFLTCIAMTPPVYGFFIFRKPPLSYVQNIFILPFEANLWLTDISVLLICAIFLYIIIIWEWKILDEENVSPDNDMIDSRFSDAILFTIGAVCQQGYATEPKGNSGKILILTVFITLIFLFTAYTAYTVVLFQSTANNIKTLEDLYDSKMKLGSDDKPYFRGMFPTYTDTISKKIYEERIAPKGLPSNYYPLHEGLDKIRNEYFAFCVDQMSGYKAISDSFLENEKCGLEEIQYLQESNPYIAAPPDVPHITLFKIAMFRIKETGLNTRELNRRINKKPKCVNQGNNYRSAGILDLYSLYMLLCMGLGLSVCILIIEILTHKYYLDEKFQKKLAKIKHMK